MQYTYIINIIIYDIYYIRLLLFQVEITDEEIGWGCYFWKSSLGRSHWGGTIELRVTYAYEEKPSMRWAAQAEREQVWEPWAGTSLMFSGLREGWMVSVSWPGAEWRRWGPRGRLGPGRAGPCTPGEMFGIYSKSNGKLVTLRSEMTNLCSQKIIFRKGTIMALIQT